MFIQVRKKKQCKPINNVQNRDIKFIQFTVIYQTFLDIQLIEIRKCMLMDTLLRIKTNQKIRDEKAKQT